MLHKLLRTRLFCAWRGHPLSDDVTETMVACPCRQRVYEVFVWTGWDY